MTKRLAILLLVTLGGLGLVFALPRNPTIAPSALASAGHKITPPKKEDPKDTAKKTPWIPPDPSTSTLRNTVALWDMWEAGPFKEPTEDEKGALAGDTVFEKRDYYRPKTFQSADGRTGRGLEEAQVSLIYSGQDMGNSIHRLERCLQAQGFTIEEKSTVTDKIKLWDDKPMPATRLLYSIHDAKGNKYTNLTYYFFVGHETICSDHWARTGIDIWDRVTRGLDQEWAYLSISMLLEPHVVYPSGKSEPGADGKAPPAYVSAPISVQEADASLQQFIADLMKDSARRHQLKEYKR